MSAKIAAQCLFEMRCSKVLHSPIQQLKIQRKNERKPECEQLRGLTILVISNGASNIKNLLPKHCRFPILLFFLSFFLKMSGINELDLAIKFLKISSIDGKVVQQVTKTLTKELNKT